MSILALPGVLSSFQLSVVMKDVHHMACFFSREEVSGEARRALRSLPSTKTEKEGSRPMPSFPEMVSYIQEKVWCFDLRLSHTYVIPYCQLIWFK